MQSHITANEAAEYLVWLAAHECEDDPDFLTPLKLQKLLYYAQGWALAEWGEPLFPDRIEAWRDGPVVPSVYDRYKGRERLPIVPDKDAPPPQFHERDRALIRGVWDAYKRHSGWMLRDMTHLEPPYLATYRPDAQGRCSRAISSGLIAQEFRERVSRSAAKLAASRGKLRAFAAANTRSLTGRDIH